MKKIRRVGNKTDTNFFTSEFKLTSTEFPRPVRQNKMHSTFSQFKQVLLREESKTRKRYISRQNKPVIEQLKFLTSQKEDNFKLPQTASKRSVIKNVETSKEKEKKMMLQVMEDFYQETKITEQKKRSMGYLQQTTVQRKFKQLSVSRLKDQLEKTALQKFRGAISKQNDQNQNNISETNAQALYLLLKTSQKKMSKDVSRIRQHTQEQEYDEDPQKQLTLKNKNQTMRQTYEPNAEQSRQRHHDHFEVRTNQALPPFRDMVKKGLPDIFPPKAPSKKDIKPPSKGNVILDVQSRQRFSSSSEEHSSQNNFDLPEESQITKKKSKVQEVRNTNIFEKEGKKELYSMKSAAKRQQDFKEIVPASQQRIELGGQNRGRQNTDQVQNRSRKKKQGVQYEVEKQRPPKIDTKTIVQNKRAESPDILADIPSAKVIDPSRRITEANRQQRDQSDKNGKGQSKDQNPHFLNNHGIERVLTTKTLEDKQRIQNIGSKVKCLRAPPNLHNLPNTPKQGKQVNYQSEDVDEDELEDIDIGYRNKPIQTKKLQQNLKKPEVSVSPKIQAIQKHGLKPQTSPKPHQNKPEPIPQPEDPEQSEADVLDELQFYIQKIEDIGQYRINSKDLYNDKSIGKQILQTYKICAYFMAHQFMFLTKKTHSYLSSGNITKDFYGLSAEEINGLKSDGLLEEWIDNLQTNLEESKKLLKKCYEEVKSLLKKEEQILLLDGKTNYHLKCCASLIKEFRMIYGLYERKPQSETIQKRCCYLIELFTVIKLLNGEEIKECLDLEEIKDYNEHIKTYKTLLAGQ